MGQKTTKNIKKLANSTVGREKIGGRVKIEKGATNFQDE